MRQESQDTIAAVAKGVKAAACIGRYENEQDSHQEQKVDLRGSQPSPLVTRYHDNQIDDEEHLHRDDCYIQGIVQDSTIVKTDAIIMLAISTYFPDRNVIGPQHPGQKTKEQT